MLTQSKTDLSKVEFCVQSSTIPYSVPPILNDHYLYFKVVLVKSIKNKITKRLIPLLLYLKLNRRETCCHFAWGSAAFLEVQVKQSSFSVPRPQNHLSLLAVGQTGTRWHDQQQAVWSNTDDNRCGHTSKVAEPFLLGNEKPHHKHGIPKLSESKYTCALYIQFKN